MSLKAFMCNADCSSAELVAADTSPHSLFHLEPEQASELPFFYAKFLKSALEQESFTGETALMAARSLSYLESEGLISTDRLLERYTDKFLVSVFCDYKEVIGLAKAFKCLYDTYGLERTETLKSLIEVKIFPMALEDSQDALKLLNYCYELQDCLINVDPCRETLESMVDFNENISLPAYELHIELYKWLQERMPKRMEDQVDINSIRKIENLYTYPHSCYKVQVFKVYYNTQIAALKLYKINNLEIFPELQREFDTIRDLSGKKGFAACYGGFTTKKDDKIQLGILLEYCPTTLDQEINRRSAKYSEEEMIAYIRDFLELFFYLKKYKSIAHRDIKPENIMVSEDREIKIIDFNISLSIHGSVTRQSIGEFLPAGTFDYMAPEQKKAYVKGRAFTGKIEAADVYSLGLTILRMETLDSIKEILVSVESSLRKVRFPWLSNMLLKMLKKDFMERCTFREAISMLPE